MNNSPILNEKIEFPYIIGVAGGSGSGKTTLCERIINIIKIKFKNSISENIVIINQDSYYKGGSAETNYDIPESIDFNLLIEHLKILISGGTIEYPIYDFSTHSRKNETIKIKSAKVIIVEGILIFTQHELLKLLKLKIFVTAGEATMIFRRIERDMYERGRTFNEIKNRYLRDVEDSYTQYVYPSQRHADFIVNNRNGVYTNLDIILYYFEHILESTCN